MPLPQVGEKAPPFSLQDADGKTVKLADFKGQHVVLYFYPKDDTPGCTREACDFRDEHTALERAGAVVLGVSPDSPEKHQKFRAKYQLPFTLLADPDHEVCEKYGVWMEKMNYGKRYWGVGRTTFLIGPDAKVRAVWPKVKVEGHVAEVQAALKQAS
jgi:thioredoxin-dependent peroxiredoxin